MKILGLDISSSCSGWSVLDYTDNQTKLLDYGLIQPTGNMEVDQRLFFFGNEAVKIINKVQPDEIVIEETIMVHGSPSIMRTMSSFRGVALFQAYSYQKRTVRTYIPAEWRKMIGLSGSFKAKKAETQLFVCEKFNLLNSDKIKFYKMEFEKLNSIDISGVNRATKKADLEKANKVLEQRISDGISHEFTVETSQGTITVPAMEATQKGQIKKADIRRAIKVIERNYNKISKSKEKEVNKKWDKLSTDIYSDSGLNSDAADATGVGLAFIIEIWTADEKQDSKISL